MKPTAAFINLWLATDTFSVGMSATNYQHLRRLCELFYEAGKKERDRVYTGQVGTAVATVSTALIGG